MKHPILFHMRQFTRTRPVPPVPEDPSVSIEGRSHRVLDPNRIVGDPLVWSESPARVAHRAAQHAMRWTLHEALNSSGYSAEERKGWLLGSYLKQANHDPARRRRA